MGGGAVHRCQPPEAQYSMRWLMRRPQTLRQSLSKFMSNAQDQPSLLRAEDDGAIVAAT